MSDITDNDVVNFLQVGDQVYAMSEVAAITRVDMATLGRQQKVITPTPTPTPPPHSTLIKTRSQK